MSFQSLDVTHASQSSGIFLGLAFASQPSTVRIVVDVPEILIWGCFRFEKLHEYGCIQCDYRTDIEICLETVLY